LSLIAKSTQMFLSIALRLATNFVVFVILARVWDVRSFGAFMYSFTVSTLIGLLIDYGFGLQLLRDIGHEPSRTREIVSNALRAKLILLVPVLAISFGVILIPPISPASIPVFLLLLLSVVLNSTALLFNFAFRANQRFNVELRLSAWANSIFFVFAAVASLAGGKPIFMAGVFAFARCVYLIISGRVFARTFGWPALLPFRSPSVRNMLTTGFPFCVHLSLGTLYFQVDTIVIRALLGDEAVGLYQPAIRLVMGLLVVTEVLSNVFLPSMAAIRQSIEKLLSEGRRLTHYAFVTGTILATIMLLWSRDIIVCIYSTDYLATVPVFSVFSIVLFLRYMGISFGITLTVCDRQSVRAAAVSIAVVLSIFLNLILVHRFGIVGAAWSSVITHIVLNLIYVIYTRVELGFGLLTRRSYGMFLCAALVAAIYLLFGSQPWLLKALETLAVIVVILSIGISPAEWKSVLAGMQKVLRREKAGSPP